MTDSSPEQDATPQDATPQEASPQGLQPTSAATSTDEVPATDAERPAEASAEGADAGSDGDAGDPVDAGDDSEAGAAASRPASAAARLEEEGEVAADYLEELLDILDLDGDIDIDVENGRASVSVVADAGSARSLQRLVGTGGQVLEALQELTRLAVQAKTGERTRLMLDVAGFRAERRRELEKVAAEAVESVRSAGAPVSLPPMSPFERKVVHDSVAAAGLRSESEGEDSGRHVVVLPVGA